ncbi:MAG: response regulator [archaeon]|nr:response regulator [archaeon]
MIVFAVDDEEDALALITGAIKINLPDAELYPFNSASAAISFAEKTCPDIAFLDIAMPEMSGIDLAKKLKSINPKINLIFATAYSEYMGDAFSLHASGYLMKPISSKSVKKELENLRSPVTAPEVPVFVHTFGNFEIYVDGEPVSFSRRPAKEVLAYLVDRKGAVVSKKELCEALFKDPDCTHKSMDYLSKIIKDLGTTLDKAGVGRMIHIDRKECFVVPEHFLCDAYEYFKGNPEYMNKFSGDYMSQFEWAQDSVSKFYR